MFLNFKDKDIILSSPQIFTWGKEKNLKGGRNETGKGRNLIKHFFKINDHTLIECFSLQIKIRNLISI